jgi:hypothetical protein
MRRILTLVAVSLAGSAGPAAAQPPSRVAFTAELTATIQSGGRAPVVLYREVRAVSSSGSKRIVQQQASDGRLVERYQDPRKGMLKLDPDRNELVRVEARPGAAGRSTLGRPAGKAMVLGYETDVYEQTAEGLTSRYFRAPALGGEVIKIVQQGADATFTVEATRITLGEPAPEMVALPDVPMVASPAADR